MTADTTRAERRDRLLTVEGLEIHYSEWGEGAGDPVVCVHGFSRNGRAFDSLARALVAEGYRVLCPDVPGRGASEWSRKPGTDYRPYDPDGLPRYLRGFCEALVDEEEPIRWVGTSMGGAIGILLAGGALRDRIDRLVVNDIGPGPVDPGGEESTGADHIRQYRDPPTSRTLGELEAYFEARYGDRDPSVDLRHLTVTSARRTDGGAWTHDYDPAIVDAYLATGGPRDLWTEWDAIGAETLVLRGTGTHILPESEFEAMRSRGPETEVIELPGVGHAPSLDTDEQVETIVSFLS
ncbi:MAG: alpha/beta hydrolase [Haloarculaceae archaeon]